MCGIAGFLRPSVPADAGLLRRMCGRIRHRGPDDDGYYIDGACGLGMRRLSIIDLPGGHQPIANEDGAVWVVFNGEIYNYRELRCDLEKRGHRFRTASDTEVLVHLYEEEGPAGAGKLRGMFAYAIWDAKLRRLTLVRDRFGKKPLYIARMPSGVCFASELKSLFETDMALDVDVDALKLYFQFGYIPDPRSPYRAVSKLAAGHWITFDESGRMAEEAYWTLPEAASEPSAGFTEERARQELRELFDESVRIRMIADVPLGAFLSGGIDSGSVVASMASQSDAPVKTFSIGFEENEYNELPAARLVAQRYGTEHHEIVLRPDSAALISRLAGDFDEPFGDSSAIPTFLVSQFAAQHVKVALTGDGGDELFAGYESFAAMERLKKADRLPQSARRMLSGIASVMPYSAYGKNYLRMISRPSGLERYFEWNYAPHFLRERLLEPEWTIGFAAPCPFPESEDILTQALYFEATSKLTGDMLVKVDRMSMANSLEVRSPLLDHKLAEFAARIPHAWKIRNGRGKDILLRAIGDRLPPELLKLPKKGFAIPLDRWFRGPLRGFLRDALLSRSFLDRGFVRERALRQLLDEHQRGRRNNVAWLFRLLMLELWYRERDPALRSSREASSRQS